MSSTEGEYSSNNSANEMENPELIQFIEVKSKRGASLLTRNGFEYAYEKNSATINNVEYWKCPKVSFYLGQSNTAMFRDLLIVPVEYMCIVHGMKIMVFDIKWAGSKMRITHTTPILIN